ncbi:unnamed protein product [Blepharisma stoltei]|uniref:Polycystin cation channel PKD1/PKD2 domain-containing protein n=1 Tax=Blepharisma stoltei TaxID=1481888 RepID=A0AAU9IJW0_9CILI|nr:unnamed protein product [Blepharisma stoltei]
MEDRVMESSSFIEKDAEAGETDTKPILNMTSSLKKRQKDLESISRQKGQLTIDDIELVDQELEAIEKKLSVVEKDLERSLEATPVNVKGVYISVIVSLIFIVLSIFINRVDKSSPVSLTIIDFFENTVWAGNPNKYFNDIESLTDLDTYYRRVLFPGAFTNEFINKYNYVVGLRLSLKRAILKENPFSEYEEAVRWVRKDPDLGAGDSNSDGEEKNDLGIFNYSSGGGFREAGAYFELFCNLTLQDALVRWRVMKPIWLSPDYFVSITAELLVQNSNMMTTLYYYQTIERTSSGSFSCTSDSVGIFPEAYESWTPESKIVVILGLIYIAGFLLQIYKFVQSIIRICTTLWTKLKLDIAWHEYLEIVTLLLVITSISLFLQNVIGNIGKLQIPIDSESQFSDFVVYCQNFKILIRVTAVATLLIIFRVLVILKSKFPSFGVLFDTINMAKNDIMNFGFITILLIIAFSLSAFVGFGLTTNSFSTFGTAMSSLWSALLAIEIIDEMTVGNYSIAGVFYIVFISLFYFIILNTFLAIVLSVYTELRSRSQLLLEARARMLTEDSNAFIEILLNFLLLRIKNTLEEDAIEYQTLSVKSTTNAQEQEEINDRMRRLENTILLQSQQNIFSIVKYNFGQLQLALRGAGSSLLTREQLSLKLKNTIRTMEQEKAKNEILKKVRENEVNYNFKLFVEMILYIIFIIIYVIAAKYRLRIEESFALNSLVADSLAVPKFVYSSTNVTFYDINNAESAYEFLQQIMVPYIESQTVAVQNHFLTSPKVRVTMNRYKLDKNDNSFSNSVIKNATSYPPEYNHENLQGLSTLTKFRYISSGTKETFKKEGGCTYELFNSQDIQQAFINSKADGFVGNETNVFALEWITYNINMNMFVYAYISFTLDVSGKISPSLSSKTVELDVYTQQFQIRAVLDVIFLLFIIYFICQFGYEWLKIMRKLAGERKRILRGKKAVRDVLNKLKGNNNEENKAGMGIIFSSFGKKIRRGLVWIIFTVKQLFQSLIIFLKMDMFKLLQLISVILSVIQLAFLATLMSNDFVRNYKIGDDWENSIGEFSEISDLYTQYEIITCFNCLIIFLRFLEYFEFSKQLSLLTDILSSAKLDLIFFILMFFIVIIGYTIMGYLIFGQAITNFRLFNYSLFSTFSVLVGQFSVNQIISADGKIGMLWFLTLSIIFNLLLLNIFIAIIYAHYNTGKDSRKMQQIGFFKKIILILKAKWQRKELMEWEDAGDDKAKEKDSQDTPSEGELPKTSENLDYEIETVKPVNYTVNAWIRVLEESLLEKSNGKINLPNLKEENVSAEKVVLPAMLQEVVFVEENQWLQEDALGKLKIWRQLSILHNDYLRRKIEKAIQEGLEPPESSELSNRQMQLWDITPPRDKLTMWMGEESFQNEERVLVWNAAVFDRTRFSSDAEEWSPTIQRHVWVSLEDKDKRAFAKKWIGDIKYIVKAYKSARDPIAYLLKQEWLESDKRMLLWISMSKNEKAKIALYLNQSNRIEAEIIAYLLLEERDNNVFALDDSDATITSLLDSKLYDKLYECAVFQAENNAAQTSSERVDETKGEIKNLKNYNVHLEEDLKNYKKQNKYLKEKAKKLREKCEKLMRA